MPGWMLAALGAVFVVGVLLLFASWLLSGTFSGTPGWALASWASRHSAARWRRNSFWSDRPRGGSMGIKNNSSCSNRKPSSFKTNARGSTSNSLRAARRRPGSKRQKPTSPRIEELLPLEAKRQSAEQQLPLAEREAEQAKNKLRTAHNAWQSALAAAGLPKKLSPKQIRQLRRSASGRADLRRAIRRGPRTARPNPAASSRPLTARIEPLFAESGLTPTGRFTIATASPTRPGAGRRENPCEPARIDVDGGKETGQLTATKRRAAVEALRRRGKSLLHRAGAANRAELSRKAAERSAADDLAKRRELLHRGLIAACTGICEPAEIAALLDGSNRAQLVGAPAAQYRKRSAPIDAARGRLHELLEQRGRLGREMDSLANEPRLGVLQLQLAASEQALAEAIQPWQVVCTRSRFFSRSRMTTSTVGNRKHCSPLRSI